MRTRMVEDPQLTARLTKAERAEFESYAHSLELDVSTLARLT